MPTNKEAARVLAHPNGQRCELTQIHNHILLHVVRFGKVFCKTCAVMLALLGLAALAALPTATVSAVLTLIGAIAALNWVCGAWFTLCEWRWPYARHSDRPRLRAGDPQAAQHRPGFERLPGRGSADLPLRQRLCGAGLHPPGATGYPNRHYIDRWYYGRLCIVGWRNNRMTDLPADLAEELCRRWADVEVQL